MRHRGIPGKGLEFGLAGECGLDERAEVLASQMSVGGMQGVHGMEDLHGAKDGDAEPFDLLMGEIRGGFDRIPLLAAFQVNKQREGKNPAGDENAGNPEQRSWQASRSWVHGNFPVS